MTLKIYEHSLDGFASLAEAGSNSPFVRAAQLALEDTRILFGFVLISNNSSGNPASDKALSFLAFEDGDVVNNADGLWRYDGTIFVCISWIEKRIGTGLATLVGGTENKSIVGSGERLTGRAAVELWMQQNANGVDDGDSTESVEIRRYGDEDDTDSDALTTDILGYVEFAETNVDGAVAADTTVTVDSATGLAVGDKVRFYDATNGEQFRIITGISGSDLTVASITLADDANVSRVVKTVFDFFNVWKLGLTCANAIDSISARYVEG